MKIVLDVDEVLADFTGEVAELFGLDREEFHLQRKASLENGGSWYMESLLSRMVGEEIDQSDIWASIAQYPGDGEIEFWHSLEWKPRAKEIIEIVERSDANFHIATSPGRSPESVIGKTLWLADAFPNVKDLSGKATIIRDKWRLASPGRVLIDDRRKNCEQWCDPPRECSTAKPLGGLAFHLSPYPSDDDLERLDRYLTTNYFTYHSV